MSNLDQYDWKDSWVSAYAYLVPAIFRIFKKLSIPYSYRILDAGCGGGYIMHKLYQAGYRDIFGFDISKSAIGVANRNFSELAGRVKIHDAYESKLPDAFNTAFEVIISVEVIEHMYTPSSYLGNLNLWLKKGGFLIISTPYHGYMKNLATAVLNRFDSHFGSLSKMGHIKFFSKATLSELLDKSGFRVVEFSGCGRLPYLWKSMLLVAQKI